MNHKVIFTVALLILVPISAAAQHSTYSGEEKREIKALSEQEVEQHLAGAGMGYARAAELNRYPGPMHVLELALPLALDAAQSTATRQLMQTHKAEARALGAKLVAAERELDGLFASGSANQAALAQQLRAVAMLQGEYRLSHLDTHRRMRALLSAEQVEYYVLLRGYAGGRQSDPSHRNTHQHKAEPR